MTDKRNKLGWQLVRFVSMFAIEIIGWGLMVTGMYIWHICYQDFLKQAAVLEGFLLTIMGLVSFRGGLQLVKVSVAARAFRADRRAIPDPASGDYGPA